MCPEWGGVDELTSSAEPDVGMPEQEADVFPGRSGVESITGKGGAERVDARGRKVKNGRGVLPGRVDCAC